MYNVKALIVSRVSIFQNFAILMVLNRLKLDNLEKISIEDVYNEQVCCPIAGNIIPFNIVVDKLTIQLPDLMATGCPTYLPHSMLAEKRSGVLGVLSNEFQFAMY
ncbi:15851_t:CDS:2 [Funneliformis mosseae]|uniref:15851_t:CDS:1 n=1 Tax=Funneliformis mosseae TaxID=27381 RepID=A0A9N9ANJ6_FUNMO|nr:15851_t:CDS:2 [Funneliformis mosseae]